MPLNEFDRLYEPGGFYTAYYSDEGYENAHNMGSSSLWNRVIDFLDYVTGPRFAVAVAILVLIFFQFQDQFYNWIGFYFRRDVSFMDSITALGVQTVEIIRAYWQVCIECMRPKQRLERVRRQVSGQMPELEIVETTVDDRKHSNVSKGRARKRNRDELEPAFLYEDDYPPGWLVYHPVLGVVEKTEADRYDEEKEREPTPDGEDENREERSRQQNGHAKHPSRSRSNSSSRDEGDMRVLQSIPATG